MLTFTVDVPAVAVFIEGVLSFFSPCILPLLPLYLAYLSGAVFEEKGEAGKNARFLLRSVYFILGIASSFFILGLMFCGLGSLLTAYKGVLSGLGAVVAILFGLYQLGLFGSIPFFEREVRLPFHTKEPGGTPASAFLLGFVFSFSWSPCVGPALAGVLLMASSAQTRARGFLFVGLYALGFILSFLVTAVFGGGILSFLKKRGRIFVWIGRASGILLIMMGVFMLGQIPGMGLSTGTVTEEKSVLAEAVQTYEAATKQETGVASSEGDGAHDSADGELPSSRQEISGQEESQESEEAPEHSEDPGDMQAESTANGGKELPAAPWIELSDQYGNWHSLSDYAGKTVFLNFWATWCPPCRAEMPDIQALYETLPGEGDKAVVILGVATPGLGGETDREGVETFLAENGYTYPVLMDETGELTFAYGISAYPTTFMIDRDGNVFGYVTGQMSREIMEDVIRQAQEGRMD